MGETMGGRFGHELAEACERLELQRHQYSAALDGGTRPGLFVLLLDDVQAGEGIGRPGP